MRPFLFGPKSSTKKKTPGTADANERKSEVIARAVECHDERVIAALSNPNVAAIAAPTPMTTPD